MFRAIQGPVRRTFSCPPRIPQRTSFSTESRTISPTQKTAQSLISKLTADEFKILQTYKGNLNQLMFDTECDPNNCMSSWSMSSKPVGTPQFRYLDSKEANLLKKLYDGTGVLIDPGESDLLLETLGCEHALRKAADPFYDPYAVCDSWSGNAREFGSRGKL